MDQTLNSVLYFGAAAGGFGGFLSVVSSRNVWRPLAMLFLSVLFYADAIVWQEVGETLKKGNDPIPWIMSAIDIVAVASALAMIGLLYNEKIRDPFGLFCGAAFFYCSSILLYWILLVVNGGGSKASPEEVKLTSKWDTLRAATKNAFGADVLDIVSWLAIPIFALYCLASAIGAIVALCGDRGAGSQEAPPPAAEFGESKDCRGSGLRGAVVNGVRQALLSVWLALKRVWLVPVKGVRGLTRTQERRWKLVTIASACGMVLHFTVQVAVRPKWGWGRALGIIVVVTSLILLFRCVWKKWWPELPGNS